MLKGPNPKMLMPIVGMAMPMLIELLQDNSIVVRDTAAWTVGRLCEIIPKAVINKQYLTPVLDTLARVLNANPYVIFVQMTKMVFGGQNNLPVLWHSQ